MKSKWNLCLLAALFAVASVGALPHSCATAQEQDELEGPIVQIGPAKDGEAVAEANSQTPAEPPEPAYWIGLRGRGVEDPVLRTQLQLAEDMGIVIEEIVPESPAEQAGLRKHDIILRANDEIVDSMEVLQQKVQTGRDQPMELKILRLGKEIAVTVTPAERPAEFADQLGGSAGFPGQDMLGGDLGQLLQQLQNGGRLPGMALNNRQFNLNTLPNGISVSIARQGEGPAQITVKKGDQTWTLSSDDAQALEKLPEDVRGFVSNMLNNQNNGLQQQLGNLDLQAELQNMLPDRLGNLPGMGNFKVQEEELAKRMRQLEKQIEQLQQRLETGKENPE